MKKIAILPLIIAISGCSLAQLDSTLSALSIFGNDEISAKDKCTESGGEYIYVNSVESCNKNIINNL